MSPRPLPEVADNGLMPMVGNYRKLETQDVCREMKKVSARARMEQTLSTWEHAPLPKRG